MSAPSRAGTLVVYAAFGLLVTSLAATALLLLLVALSAHVPSEIDQALSVLLVTDGCLIMALLASLAWRARLVRWQMALVAVAGTASWIAWMLLLLEPWPLGWKQEERVAIVGATGLVVALVGLQNALMAALSTRSPALRVWKRALALAAWAYGLAMIALIWLADAVPPVLQETIGVSAAVCGLTLLPATGLTPLLVRLDARRRTAAVESVTRRYRLELSCPRCTSRIELASGAGRCRACGLGLHVDIEEPRCDCGYLLYRLEGDACPECGSPVVVEPPAPVAACRCGYDLARVRGDHCPECGTAIPGRHVASSFEPVAAGNASG